MSVEVQVDLDVISKTVRRGALSVAICAELPSPARDRAQACPSVERLMMKEHCLFWGSRGMVRRRQWPA